MPAQNDEQAKEAWRRVYGRRRLPEIMGTTEVAKVLGVESTNLQFIKDLPEPVAGPDHTDNPLSAGRIWLGSEIRAFAKVYKARREARHAARSAAA